MQLSFINIITFSCLYSLVISASINQNRQEIKHEKVSAAANHLLKELGNEVRTNKVSSQIESNINDQENNMEYFSPIDDDSFSSEIIDLNRIIPIYELESESNEVFIPIIQKPIMDESIMKIKDD